MEDDMMDLTDPSYYPNQAQDEENQYQDGSSMSIDGPSYVVDSSGLYERLPQQLNEEGVSYYHYDALKQHNYRMSKPEGLVTVSPLHYDYHPQTPRVWHQPTAGAKPQRSSMKKTPRQFPVFSPSPTAERALSLKRTYTEFRVPDSSSPLSDSFTSSPPLEQTLKSRMSQHPQGTKPSPFALKHPALYQLRQQDPHQSSEVQPRRIGGMVLTVYNTALSLISSFYMITACLLLGRKPDQQSEVVGVEIDGEGRKRRAVEYVSISPESSPSKRVQRLPGAFPDTEESEKVDTPITTAGIVSKPEQENVGISMPEQENAGISMPEKENVGISMPEQENVGISMPEQENVGISMPEKETTGNSMPEKETSGISMPEKETSIVKESVKVMKDTTPTPSPVAPVRDDYDWKPSEHRPLTIWRVTDDPYNVLKSTRPTSSASTTSSTRFPKVSAVGSSERRTKRLPEEAKPRESSWVRARAAVAARKSTNFEQTPEKSPKQIKNEHEDAKVDALIKKARDVLIESPEEKSFRESIRERKAREEEAVKEAEAIDRLEEEWHAELARDEELRVAKAKEAKLTKLKAAEEAAAAKKAAEEAKAVEEAEKLKKDKLIRPLDPEWEVKVAAALAKKSKSTVVGKTTEGTEITRKDLGTLLPQPNSMDDPSGWLNDEVVNGFIAAICDAKKEEVKYPKTSQNPPPFVKLESHWYTTYKQKGAKELYRWPRRQKFQKEALLKCEKIFMPVNTGAHWTLIIISPQARQIEHLDSLNGRDGRVYIAAREFLASQLGDLYIKAEWTDLYSKSARQANGDDCGVFTCMNALAAAKGKDYGVVGDGSIGDARKMMGAVLLNDGLSGDFRL